MLVSSFSSFFLVEKKEEKGYDAIYNEVWIEKCEAIKKNLYILSQHKEWWVKYFVSESIRKYPYFLEPKTIEELKKEEHPLVKKSLKEIKLPKEQTAKESLIKK